MKNRKQLSRENALKQELSYFATKHTGGQKSTKELIELCHISKGNYVLDVGCGIGTTVCLLAKNYGCRVVGIDLSEKMIEWSKKRAKKEGVEDNVEFRVADAQNLPFEDDIFDAVIVESVNAFVNDKQKAVNEYVRVTKPGGYVGLNEATWIKTPPPRDIIESFSQIHVTLYTVGLEAYGKWVNEFSADGWENLLKNAGLNERVVRTYKSTPQIEIIDRIKLVGPRRILWLWAFSFTSPTFREWIKKVKVPKKAFEYYGYGIYVGKK